MTGAHGRRASRPTSTGGPGDPLTPEAMRREIRADARAERRVLLVALVALAATCVVLVALQVWR
ncbi:hypothetical protein KIN34_07450 [Cellulomonas sp. DKR-3]|uniref:Uncharacterized protein n=1 Tax=Cellulomonas fulva TaxID=2835530 RepID=A0ABS5TY88_9CELL|nr:hypothetical protein [Cellulomonas fulva]MBT0994118.1 hypothetical protein [Cellulomonas fulva]